MKQLYSTLLFLLLSLTATAQSANDKFTVKRTNGQTTEYKLSEYDRITYKDSKQYIHKIGNESKIGTSIDNIESITFDIFHQTDVTDVRLADNAATDDAKRLYKYLRLNYGVKTISSIMANVNWNNDEAEKVYQATGKYPAMNCYDFIHICFSAPGTWINYEDITPVTNWVQAGGLVSLMWHFNVPKAEGSTDVTCTPSETTFKATNALVSGTWENKWFYEQMDKVVSVLLKLQNAGMLPSGVPSTKLPATTTTIPPGGPGSGGVPTEQTPTSVCGPPCSTTSARKVSTTSSGYGPHRTITATAPNTTTTHPTTPATTM